ncbi:MAG TPA: pilin [Candidatus Absconditabacterales bacterium]|nr:pilin [Candidatus Absconditabacterales bacterium]HMT26872.1 pilin [Candidatus Absconditabacterales bacterium]
MNKEILAQNTTSSSALGIKCSQKDLINGQCSFNIYETLGIRKQNQDTTVETFVSDVVLSATFFIGTIVTLALIYSGLLYVLSGSDEKQAAQGKQGIRYALIGLVLVAFSYVVVRAVQFLAKGM